MLIANRRFREIREESRVAFDRGDQRHFLHEEQIAQEGVDLVLEYRTWPYMPVMISVSKRRRVM